MKKSTLCSLLSLLITAGILAVSSAYADTVHLRDRNLALQPRATILGHGEAVASTRTILSRRLGRPTEPGGFSQQIIAEGALWDRIEIKGWGSLHVQGSTTGGAFGAGIKGAILKQGDSMPLNLAVGIEGLRESDGTPVLLADLAINRTFGRGLLGGSMVLEKPFAADRDAVDILLTLGGGWYAADWVFLGLEAIGSDLEAFVEAEEAEGGARLGVGPTVAMHWLEERLGVTVSGLAGLATLPRPSISTPIETTPGWLAQAEVSWAIR